MFHKIFACGRGLVSAGLVAAALLTPVHTAQAAGAPNVSPGCAAINAGALDNDGSSSDAREFWSYLVAGDEVTINYTLPYGGALRLHGNGDNNSEVIFDEGSAASGTLSYRFSDFNWFTRLASRDVVFSATATCVPAPPRPVVHQRGGVDALANQSTSTNADADATFDWETIEISTPPAHGTARYELGQLIYTPNPGFTGYDEFYYTATNQGVASVPAIVNYRVATGPVDMQPADGSLPTGWIGETMTFQLSALNCAGKCTYSVNAGNFRGGDISVDPDTGLLTITPRKVSPIDDPWYVEVMVTDEGEPIGSWQDWGQYTIEVKSRTAPTASDSTHRAFPYGYTDITPRFSGDTRSLRIVSSPAHGYAEVMSNNDISYEPDNGFLGTDQLTFVAVNENGESAPATVTLNVGAPIMTPEAGALPRAEVDKPYTVQFGFDPHLGDADFTLTDGALPEGLELIDGVLSGTPPASAAGTYTFTIRGVSGDYEDEFFAAYTLAIGAEGIAGTDKEITLRPGETPLPVDLTAGATGGPFTDAALISLEPPNAGTIKLTSGEVASIDYSWVPGNFYLKFIPNPEFSGTAVVRYVLRSNMGISDPAMVTFRAPLAVKAVSAHVDGLVRSFVNERQNLIAAQVDHPGLLERRRMASGQQPGTAEVSPTNNSVALNFSSSLAEMQSWQALEGQAGAETSDPFNAWVEGRFVLHLRNDGTLEHKGDFGLLSVGADYLVNEQLLLGVALHADSMRDFAKAATTQGKGVLVGPYMSVELVDNVYLDASLLYGKSWNEVSTAFFSGTFETDRVLGKARLTGNWQIDEALSLRPDATMVLSTERAGDYTVRNAQGDEVTVAGFTSTQLRVSAGALLEYRMALDNGLVLTPQFGGSLGLSSSGQSINPSRVFGTVTLGLQLLSEGGWTFGTGLDLGIDGAGSKSAAIRARLAASF